jgi:hypothetical protein
VRAVVATSALELGIDIGALDAAILTGYPGSAASFFQQAGRAGRRGRPSLAVMVGRSVPLDQYILRHPEYLLERPREATVIDPDNTLLWRMNRIRLDAEVIRDAMLAVSGQLNLQSGGPSIHPELPPGLSERYGWKPSKDAEQRNRRSVYVFVRRNLRYPLFELFDMPDTNETCGRRNRTTTAPQALFILNSELILSEARSFAGRVLKEAGTDPYTAITRAYRLALGRDPSGDEIALATGFLGRQVALISVRSGDSEKPKLALPTPMPQDHDPAAGAAFTDLCHALLNANEFIYVD